MHKTPPHPLYKRVHEAPIPPDVDTLLQDGLLHVPADFTAQVMAHVHVQAHAARQVTLAAPQRRWPKRWNMRQWLQCFALLGGSLAGVAQVLVFIFGIWSTMSAV
jgi:hypothetical protein